MDLKRNAPEPLYVQLADAIAADIASGRYKPGDRLRTEEQLVADHGVSRVTVREAMKTLEARGLVTRHRAKGTFVAGPKVSQDLGVLQGFYDTLVQQGIEPEARLLDYRPVSPPPAVQRLLRQDRAMLLVRQFWVHSEPLALTTSYLHPVVMSVPRAIAEIHPTYRILQEMLGQRIDHANLAIRALPAGRDEAKRLDLKPYAPILVVERTSFGTDGVVLEHAILHLRADTYEFALAVRGSAPVAAAMRPAVRQER